MSPTWHAQEIGGDSLGVRAKSCYVLSTTSLENQNRMSRDDLVAMEGKVVEVLVGGNFKIDVQGGHTVLAHLAGRMRRNRIRVVLGDQVTVSVSPYDPARGLITYRGK